MMKVTQMKASVSHPRFDGRPGAAAGAAGGRAGRVGSGQGCWEQPLGLSGTREVDGEGKTSTWLKQLSRP